MNFPVKLGVSPAAVSTPTGVFNQWFEALFSHTGTLGCTVCHPVHRLLPHQPAVALPIVLHNPPLCLAPISTPLTSLDECFFFFLGCRTSIQFNFLSVLVVFFVFKFLFFFWLCKEAQCVYLRLHLGQKSPAFFFI